ncbi:hypothetical protein OEV98_10805 [Caldibacillus lycopersici]|uniref:Uncharacterized protein n=1 Tax=Perspicuibacillus lycopersici TaxID=1325689 RepID=A0AAE3LR05_9BACI|nr:hypothetical protein [Perspicuibacillus lycopersici]MCU9614049.1 hypothetical protein [Perspicuibacillus lycopersici]
MKVRSLREVQEEISLDAFGHIFCNELKKCLENIDNYSYQLKDYLVTKIAGEYCITDTRKLKKHKQDTGIELFTEDNEDMFFKRLLEVLFEDLSNTTITKLDSKS